MPFLFSSAFRPSSPIQSVFRLYLITWGRGKKGGWAPISVALGQMSAPPSPAGAVHLRKFDDADAVVIKDLTNAPPRPPSPPPLPTGGSGWDGVVKSDCPGGKKVTPPFF